MTSVSMVFVTAPDQETATRLTTSVVKEELAACGNILPSVRSIYRWQGKVHDEAESMVIFKTTRTGSDRLRERLVELHPYECPEVLVVHTDAGHADYLSWVEQSVRKMP